MSGPHITPEGVSAEAQVFRLVIEYSPASGELRCHAPPDSVLALGMLGAAIEIVNSRTRENIRSSNIVKPVF
jgi:hypothetical protein